MLIIVNLLSRLSSALFSTLANLGIYTFVFTWDFSLFVLNIFAPRIKKRNEDASGKETRWGEYKPPEKGDSRCSCPALNAMANHGILPRNGKDITFVEMNHKIRQTYNFAPTFSFFVPRFMAGLLGRSYWSGNLSLSDIDVHNGIEHDGSLCRNDTDFEKDQSKPCVPLIEELLNSATGKPDRKGKYPDSLVLTPGDLSRMMTKRRVESKRMNGQYTSSTFHKMFGSSNAATLIKIFGGKIPELRTVLLEERLPDGWESSCRNRFGLTFMEFNGTVTRIEAGIREKDYRPADEDNMMPSGSGDSDMVKNYIHA